MVVHKRDPRPRAGEVNTIASQTSLIGEGPGNEKPCLKNLDRELGGGARL